MLQIRRSPAAVWPDYLIRTLEMADLIVAEGWSSAYRSESGDKRCRCVCVEGTMMKIMILVALTFALIALVDRAPTKTG
jgi:hypothetical protein